MIQGSPKFDGIAVAKIEVDFLRNPTHIDVQAAFINILTGDTHGWTRGFTAWSDETRGLIRQLSDAMERDLAARHFNGDGTSITAASQQAASTNKVGGLGEHLGQDSVDGAQSV